MSEVLAMTDAGSIFLGWGLTLGSIGLYAFRLIMRGKVLARRLPDEDKPWI